MKSKHPRFSDGNISIFHLVTLGSQGKPICGEASPDALIGSYVEHLDTSSSEVQWVRGVFGPQGKPVKACPRCFLAYPSELKQITPFSVIVTIQFDPDKAFSGYRLNAKAIAQIGDRYETVKVYPNHSFTTAQWFYSLHFGIDIDANSIVPWVNKANKG